MDSSEVLRIFLNSPFGLVIYEPLISSDGVVDDMVLRWHNRAVQRITNIPLGEVEGSRISEFAGERWKTLQQRFTRLVTTGEPFGYVHESEGLAFMATAWYAEPYVAVKVRETSDEGINITDAGELGAALRILEARTSQTLALARLLSEKVGTEGIEPSTSAASTQRSAN